MVVVISEICPVDQFLAFLRIFDVGLSQVGQMRMRCFNYSPLEESRCAHVLLRALFSCVSKLSCDVHTYTPANMLYVDGTFTFWACLSVNLIKYNGVLQKFYAVKICCYMVPICCNT